MIKTDVIIVGAGPIGLELAVSLKAAGANYLHFDAHQIGHTISWYPQQAHFFSRPERISIAGVPLQTADQTKASREIYLAYLRGVVKQFDLAVNTYEQVETVTRKNGRFFLSTRKAGAVQQYSAQYVVLAVGDMHEPRMLNIPGENLAHVSHYFKDPHPYFRQRLLIVGGKNSAIEAALRCYHAGADVSISYRRPAFSDSIKYWLLPEINSLIKHKRIAFYPNTQPAAIDEQKVTLAPSEFAGPGNDSLKTVHADFVLLLTGYQMKTKLLRQAGVELEGENQAPKLNMETMMTNIENLYIAGTAVAGTQVQFRSFIENCHAHVGRIVKSITGQPPQQNLINPAGHTFALPES